MHARVAAFAAGVALRARVAAFAAGVALRARVATFAAGVALRARAEARAVGVRFRLLSIDARRVRPGHALSGSSASAGSALSGTGAGVSAFDWSPRHKEVS